jgi:tetratricopeptide (TPR) repeat protein
MSLNISWRRRILPGLIAFLFLSATYLFAFPQANLLYPAIVILHVVVGILATIIVVKKVFSAVSKRLLMEDAGWAVFTAAGVLGVVLIYTGTSRAEARFLYAHILVSLLAVVWLVAVWLARRATHSNTASSAVRVFAVVTVVGLLAAAAWYQRESRWLSSRRIQNPLLPPITMDGEGAGPNGTFFPSSAQVKGTEKIPSKFFMESDKCKRCHEDIYNQWYGSAHHFSSFNNQWYRKSIEYMQDVVGTRPSKWCGGCHDPAVLYSGKMDTPIKEIVHTPEAQAGLGCMMCHSIADVKSTMGQGDFYLEYPKLHELAASDNKVMVAVHDFMVKLNPEPHRRTFLKPFMRQQTAEFCSSCHKVHLDVPVNDYRWIRGFNEYDNWQASGVSGQGARSFYYPEKPQKCVDCHMPLAPSKDEGNVNGFVHSHRFPGANTAVPTANEDYEQLALTEKFLKDGNVTVDIFALSREKVERDAGAALPLTDMATTFAVGEEAEAKTSIGETAEAAPVTAPLSRVQPVVRRGESVRVDVVVRTKKVGHFFPGGTVDAYDTWLELKATDDKGQTIFWSGAVHDAGKGPVEKGAHFYRALMVDEHGNPVNKRNAWASRAVVYVRLIPPGAADTVHYRLQIPSNVGRTIKLEARLNYRKFAWWNTQFSFAGVIDPQHARAGFTPAFDDRPHIFTGDLKGVSAKREAIPNVPIIVVAENTIALNVQERSAEVPAPKLDLKPEDWQRWNDYGIGLLLQGDLRAAHQAFERVTEVVPNNPDGWVNIARAAIQEGDMERARTVLEKALSLSPKLARAHFFYAKVLRADGDYGGAAEHLRQVLEQYPRDRVAQNDLGRILFLQKKYGEAVTQLKNVLAIDPEDLQAHYNLMLSYKGLGNDGMAREHELRYLRFKADESSQAVTGKYRRFNPEDNNERQAIHEHGSMKVSAAKKAASRVATISTADRRSSGGSH